MRSRYPARPAIGAVLSMVLSTVFSFEASAVSADASAPLSAIVQLDSRVPPGARTAAALGTERSGSGVVIDEDGLVLTIGYLVLEAAEIELTVDGARRVRAAFAGYDHETGFGLVRAERPLGIAPVPLGESDGLARGSRVLAASHGGAGAALGAFVVARREFAGSWEYLLERAIFTVPPHPLFGGAALLDRQGRLVGIGSLMVADAGEPGRDMPGNMFVPIDALKPVLADLVADGRARRAPRPWLGLYPQAFFGRLIVSRVPPGGPAARAGIGRGDLLLGVGGTPVATLPDYYRALWSLGRAGVEVTLNLLRGDRPTTVTVHSIDRHDWFRASPAGTH